MKPSSWKWRSLLALAVLLAMALAIPDGAVEGAQSRFQLHRDKVAVIPVYGPIFDPGPLVRLLNRYRREVPGLRAVVLALDTPGGDVASCQEINEAIAALREDGITVVASLGSVAASGGYYIAATCDRVVSNPGTLTGSIGVIMETMNAGKVLDKVGLEFDVVKSGEFKDAGNFTRRLSARERQLFQGIIDDVYGQFLEVVVEGRKGPLSTLVAAAKSKPEDKVSARELRAFVKGFADGRIFSGRKAVDYGLVDELGGLDHAIRAAADLAGVEDPEVVTYREKRSFAELLTGMSKSEIKGWFEKSVGARRRIGFYAW